MLAHSAAWLGMDDLRTELAVEPIGQRMIDTLGRAHDRLAGQHRQRVEAIGSLGNLGQDIGLFDSVHDRKARAVYLHTEALINGLDDEAAVARVRALQATLFPAGLSVITWSYLDEAGAVIELEQRMTRDVRETLASVPFGGGTLADLCDEWIAAGHRLGRAVQERARLEASLTAGGTVSYEVDLRAARKQWVEAASQLVHLCGLLPVSATLAERVIASLTRAIDSALARSEARNQDSEPAEGDEPVEDGEPAGGDEAGEGGEPAGGEPGEGSTAAVEASAVASEPAGIAAPGGEADEPSRPSAATAGDSQA